jgi:hypothetical protein
LANSIWKNLNKWNWFLFLNEICERRSLWETKYFISLCPNVQTWLLDFHKLEKIKNLNIVEKNLNEPFHSTSNSHLKYHAENRKKSSTWKIVIFLKINDRKIIKISTVRCFNWNVRRETENDKKEKQERKDKLKKNLLKLKTEVLI